MSSFSTSLGPTVASRLTMSRSASSGGVLANNASSGPVLNSFPTSRHPMFGFSKSPLLVSIYLVPITLPFVTNCSDLGTFS